MAARLSVHDVRHRRGRVEVLAVPHLEVAAGERLSVLGPNGAGKTTLLRLLAGVETPYAGEVRVDGVPTSRGGVHLRRRMAYATQRPGLLSTTVRRNVELPLRWRRTPRARRRVLALEALDRLGVADLADRPASTLSGGQQQRVNLARALAIDPAVLLLDEPAASLDAEARATFLTDLERALDASPTTVVHVTHQVEEAFGLADRVMVLVAGGVRQIGTPAQLVRAPVDASVATLVGYHNLLAAQVGQDGCVRVGETPTGLTAGVAPGPVTVAVFANGVSLATGPGPGLPVTVHRSRPERGHLSLVVRGAAELVVHAPVGTELPSPGARVRALLEPALSVVLPASASRSGADRP